MSRETLSGAREYDIGPIDIPYESLPGQQFMEWLEDHSSTARQKIERIAQGLFGGPIIVSPGEKGGITIQRGETRRPRLSIDFMVETRLEKERIFLKRLDVVIDRSSEAAFAGGAFVSIGGLIRRSPTVLAWGLGIATAGLIAAKIDKPGAKIDNPAKIAVDTQIGYRQDALQEIEKSLK